MTCYNCLMGETRTRAVNVTLPADLVEEGKRAVRRGEARSFSAWLARRAAGNVPGHEMQAILDAIDTANAAADPAERRRLDDRVRRQLDAAYSDWDARHRGGDAAA